MTRTGIVAALLAIYILLVFVPGAAAHANLERSSPPANAVVVDQPKQLLLWFSEQPEARLTELQLLDATGKLVASPAARPALTDPNAVVAPLPDLVPGTYVVVWRATSAVDGHTTRGSFPFTYGAGQVPTAVSVPGLSAAEPYSPSLLSIVARFLTLTGALALAGGIAFGPLILVPAAATLPERRRRRDEPVADLAAAGDRALTLTLLYAVPAIMLGTALAALAQAAESADVAPLAALGAPLERVLVGTRYGTIFAARFSLAFLAGALAYMTLRRRGLLARALPLLAASGVLATLSLGSHAAAVPSFTAVVVGLDFLHMAAASLWVGGLVQLCLVAALLRPGDRREPLAGLIGQFSFMAVAVAIIAVTGLIQALIEVGTFAALVDTPYGRALLVKLALFLAMGALGLWHWRVLGPRLAAAAGTTARGAAAGLEALRMRFRWSALAEAGLAVLILAATGVMTAEQPAKDAAVALRHASASARAGDLSFELTIWPGEPGVNRIELRVSPTPRDVEKVVVRLRHLGMEMGEQEVELRPDGDGRYVSQSGALSMSGQWEMEPLVRRRGLDDARVPMAVALNEPLTSRNEEPPPPLELTPRMLLGLEGVIFGAILVLGSRVLRRRNARAAMAAVAGGLVAILAGGYVTAMAVRAEASAPERLRNPVPIDADALARGRLLYQQNCLSCHGVAGRGDGPVGRALNPRPADLRIHVVEHPEGVIYDWITNGVPGTAMPSFRDSIAPDDRWRLVAFLKGFAENGPPPAQTAAAELRARPAAPGAAYPGPAGATSAAPAPASPAVQPTGVPRALARPIVAGADATAARADVNGREVTVQVSPARYVRGQPSTVDVSLPADAPPRALGYRFTMVGHEMPPDEGAAQLLGGGRYRIPPAERFDMGGDWRLDLDVDGRTATYWLAVSPGGAEVRFVEP